MSPAVGHIRQGEPGMRTLFREHRFALLLCALTLLLVGAPLVRGLGPGTHPQLADVVILLLFIAVLLSAVFAVSRTRAAQTVALLLAIPAVVLQGLQAWHPTDGLVVASHVLGILFLAAAVLLILKFLFTSHRVSTDLICASLCVYLLIGVLCALAYSLFQFLDPTSFLFALAEDSKDEVIRFGGKRTSIAIYYSFVTMSTLGYGDIVPISALARTCAALQAVVGQLYLAVLVARLVGLQIVHSTATRA